MKPSCVYRPLCFRVCSAMLRDFILRISEIIGASLPSLQRVVGASFSSTLPTTPGTSAIHMTVPCHSSSFFYLASNASVRLPLNLVQAQRDAFGAHTFKRIDQEGVFHEEHWLA